MPRRGEIDRVAVAEGMSSMYEDGLAKALAGTTSLEEVLRVTRRFGVART